MISKVRISFESAQHLAHKALVAQGADDLVAASVASALALADADGQTGHGLSRIPSYIDQMHCQKVDGMALPFIQKKSHQSIEIDANEGFAYPAISLAVEELLAVCRARGGIVMAAIVRSHHCGVAGHPVEKLAQGGFLGLMLANTPKAMHAFGGVQPIFGTNPIAFACPRKSHDPIVLDLSLSVAARGKIVQSAGEGSDIPDDWGVDEQGQPTTDPKEVLKGSLNAIGGTKGMALALMVEILAGAFVNSHFGFQATSFFDQEGGPPRVGQLLICMNPLEFNPEFFEQIETLVEKILEDQSARLPGSKRFANRKAAERSGLEYSEALLDSIELLAQTSR